MSPTGQQVETPSILCVAKDRGDDRVHATGITLRSNQFCTGSLTGVTNIIPFPVTYLLTTNRPDRQATQSFGKGRDGQCDPTFYTSDLKFPP